jgi:Domain of unknown function (DUF4383)
MKRLSLYWDGGNRSRPRGISSLQSPAMDAPSPARLYATLVGGLLVVAGIVGFFYSASFGSPGKVDEVFGLLGVNAWHNVVHVLTGALGLLVAGYAARQYALWLGVAYLALALWGFILGGEATILGFLPVDTADDFLHLVLGALGVAAAMATPKRVAAPAAAAT